jgi:hypothetical protein
LHAADETIEEVRAARRRISAYYGHDIDKYLAHLRELERNYPEQLKAYRTRVRWTYRALYSRARIGIIFLMAGSSAFLSGCSLDVQTVWSTRVRSPDGKWIAIGRTDQHSGPGSAAIVTGVFLAPARNPRKEELILNFFDDYLPSKGGVRLKIEWLASNHLQVTFSRHPNFNYEVVKFGDINISVRELESTLRAS